MANEKAAGASEREAAARPARFPRSRTGAAERARMRESVRDVQFPAAVRGYDRGAVERYVEQVNRLIAELEISSSPESVIRAALEEVSEETRGLLQRAHDTADEITARSRARADDRLQLAEREGEQVREAAAREAQQLRETAQRETEELRDRAAQEAHGLTETAAREAQQLRETAAREAHELTETAAREAQHLRATAAREVVEMRAAAEARVEELDRTSDAIWHQRQDLIDNLSALAQQLLRISDAEAGRFAGPGEAGAGEAVPAEPGAEQQPVAPQAEPPEDDDQISAW